MKMYNKPEVEVTLLEETDVIRTSVVGETPEEPSARNLTKIVAGNEGKSYGKSNVSIYD